MNTWLCLQMGNKDLGSQGHTSPSVADPWPRHGPLVCFLAGHSPVLVWFVFFFQGLVAKNDLELLFFLPLLPGAGIVEVQDTSVHDPGFLNNRLLPRGLWPACRPDFNYLCLSLCFPFLPLHL